MDERGRNNRRHHRRDADRGNEGGARDPCDIAEIARLQQRVRDLELRHEEYYDKSDTDVQEYEEDDGNPFGRPGRQREPVNSDPLRNMGIKIEIPEFDGRAMPDEFIDWLSTVERIFDLRDISDSNKVKLVAIKLRKYASLWWDHIKKKEGSGGQVES
jgi:hypothetical protein